MTDISRPAPLSIPERTIPVPASIGPAAAAVLAEAAARGFVWPSYPAQSDVDGWSAYAAAADGNMALMFEAHLASVDTLAVRTLRVGPAMYHEIGPDDASADDRILIHIHGGALIAGGGRLCMAGGARLAAGMNAHVFAIDYRMPPHHPYPTPLDDCMACYAHILERYAPDHIVVHGNSAGGNLAAAMMLRAQAEGLPMPAALILETPELDLTESGDTFETNKFIDTVLQQGLMPVNRVYAAGHDLASPYLSPLFGDITADFPATLLTAGTRDMFLSNAVRMLHRLRDAKVACELLVYEAMPHGGFFGTPEDDRVQQDLSSFADAAWSLARRR